jgi:SRSO17 transposase
LATGREACVEVTWRHGTRQTKTNPTAAMTSKFLAIKVRPANRDIPRNPDGTLPTRWLLVEWPDDAKEPTDYWLSNMDDATPLAELVRLAKIRWRIEHDYRELKTGLGLDHFEGRNYIGWHRHVTLVVLAQAFCTMLRLDPKPLRRPDAVRHTPRAATPPRRHRRRMPHMRPNPGTTTSHTNVTKYY